MAFMRRITVILTCHVVFILANQDVIYVENGGNATLGCPYGDDSVMWRGIGGHQYSKGQEILTSLPMGLQQRCFIEKGDGYNLWITEVTFDDEGNYTCSSENQSDVFRTVYIKVPPKTIFINNGNNGIIETDENQEIVLKCTSNGGIPTPKLTLMWGDTVLVSREENTVLYPITPNRTDDLKKVSCYADHSQLKDPINDTSVIHLNLAPISFRMDTLPVLYEQRHVNISFESSGSRPPARVECFLDNESINATDEVAILQPDLTYQVKSTLSIYPKRDHNKKIMICYSSNEVDRMETTHETEVYYPPAVKVKLELNTISDPNMVELKCEKDGNPRLFNHHKWQHLSQFNEHIRYLNVNSDTIIAMPMFNKTVAYEESGKYSCVVDNSIADSDGKVVQSGSAVVEYYGPPHLTATSNQKQYGDIGSDATISVSVISQIPLRSYNWYSKIDGDSSNKTTTLTGMKYTRFTTAAIVQDIVYNTTVHANGHIFTLSIKNLAGNDFGLYQFEAKNDKGLLSATIHLLGRTQDTIYVTKFEESQFPDNIHVVGITLACIGSLMIIGVAVFFLWRRRKSG